MGSSLQSADLMDVIRIGYTKNMEFHQVEARTIRMLRTRMNRSNDGWPRNIKPVDTYIEQLANERYLATASALQHLDSESVPSRYYAGRLATRLCNPIDDAYIPSAKSLMRALCRTATHETDERVLAQLLDALGMGTEFGFVVPHVLPFTKHRSFEVRLCAVQALCAMVNSEHRGAVISHLIVCTQDIEPWIRNWATFALVANDENKDTLDRSNIAEALIARLNDSCLEARDEAIYGLARRHDPRGLKALHKRLRMATVTILNIRSAGVYGEMSLYDDLQYAINRFPSNNPYDMWALHRCNPDESIRVRAIDYETFESSL